MAKNKKLEFIKFKKHPTLNHSVVSTELNEFTELPLFYIQRRGRKYALFCSIKIRFATMIYDFQKSSTAKKVADLIYRDYLQTKKKNARKKTK